MHILNNFEKKPYYRIISPKLILFVNYQYPCDTDLYQQSDI